MLVYHAYQELLEKRLLVTLFKKKSLIFSIIPQVGETFVVALLKPGVTFSLKVQLCHPLQTE